MPRLEHSSCYGPAIAIVRGMKLGVAKRRIGTNNFVIMYRNKNYIHFICPLIFSFYLFPLVDGATVQYVLASLEAKENKD